MDQSSELGRNRTATSLHPKMTETMLDKASEVAISDGEVVPKKMIELEKNYMREAGSIGSVPVPATAKGAGKTLWHKLKGENPEVLLDKLGERLAFERSGVRLYDQIISKCEVEGVSEEIMSRLREFRDEEAAHFRSVHAVIENLGADPTAVTPAADVAAVAGMGLFQLAGDPRATVSQSLQALLTAELVDHDGWEMLIKLCRGAGLDEAADQFEQALKEESVHLTFVRGWCEELVSSEANSLQ